MTKTLISKTLFLHFLDCPRNTWVKIHKPDIYEKFPISEFDRHLMEQGNEVESYARNLFPGGIEVVSTGDEACYETARLMTAKAPTLFQATFIVDGFIARNDALVYDKRNDSWDLYEIKGTNSIKENTADEHDHIDDLAFQASILRRAKIKVGKYFLVHLNKEYIRSGELDMKALFVMEDQTDKVLARLEKTQQEMEAAKEYLLSDKEPSEGCKCLYRGRSRHCTTFQYSNSQVPNYSVHDIARIGASKKKLESLVERDIFDLNDVPEDMDLSEIQWNQIKTHQRNKPIIDMKSISENLAKVSFPIYFLDYETFAPAIPIFNGYSPYQRIPFQLSLHVLKNASSSPEHVEYLHEERTDPSENVARLLEEHIKPGGTVISWNKSFEIGVNKEIGLRNPKYKALMERINGSMYDLRDIFQKQHYVHPGFRGSTSVKKVLPILVPDLKYEDLDIKEGGQASDAWWTMLSPATKESDRLKISKDLKIYCGLDTLAMLKIWESLISLK